MRGGQESAPDELLEREHERDRLERAIRAAHAGAGSVVLLAGEAGIGKSALLAHARRVAGETGMRVLHARGGELEREFAYGVVRQLFEHPVGTAERSDRERWLSGAAGLAASVVAESPPELGPVLGGGAVLHGLYWLSANLASEAPLLLAVDDAHWADESSIGFLSYLARRVDDLGILIVCCSRVGEGAGDALLEVIDSAPSSLALSPDALSADAAAVLIAQAFGRGVSPRFTRACHTATAGNPFLLGELLRALRQEGIVPDDSSTARVEQIAPNTIARATLTRLRQLGPTASELAFAIAVLGRSAELRHAAALAGLEVDPAAEASDALVRAVILRDGRPLEFMHPIVRTTIYSELPPGRRAASHRRAARILADDGAGDVALAPHLLASEPSGDPWVVERLRGAAHAVLEHAPAAACTYLERAHREPAPSSARLATLMALGHAESIVGRTEAIDRLREVVDAAADPETRFKAARMLVGGLTQGGRMSEAMEIGDQLLAGATPDDDEVRLRLEAELALLAQFAPRSAKPALVRLAHHRGRLTGKTTAERLILTCLALDAAHGRESAATTAQLARAALAGETLVDEHTPNSSAMYLAGWALIYSDQLEEAERHFDRALENARRRGWEGEFVGVSGSRCHVLFRQGRLAEAEADARSVLETNHPHAISRALLLSCLMHTMVERADPRAWGPFLSEHGLADGLAEQVMGGTLLYSRGHLRLAAGDARGALDDFEQLWRRDELSGQHTAAFPSRGSQALAQLGLGNRKAASSLAGAELEAARHWNTPSSLAHALRTAGLVEGGRDGIELLRGSVSAVASSPARYEHALSLTELGAALRRAGQPRTAREPLRLALDQADRCGALRLADRARDELLATGARPRRTALRGCDALTPSERRVAQLAGDGLANRQIAQALFVTLRTVEGHLTSAYSKLDINTRAELPDALRVTTKR